MPSDAIFLGKYTDPLKNHTLLFDGSSNIWGWIVNKNSAWRCPERIATSATETDSFYLPSYALNYSVFPNISLDATHPTGWEYEWKITNIRNPSHLMAFVDSTCERFDPSGFNNFYGNLYGAANNWNGGSPGCWYNHSIRHPNNGTNVGYIDGHVQTLYNRLWNGSLSLEPSLAKGDFVVHPSDP